MNMRIAFNPFVFVLVWSWVCSTSTAEVSLAREMIPHPHHASDSASTLPINVQEIVLALRWTGEMNRRLYFTSQNQPGIQRILEEDEKKIPKPLDAMRGGQTSVYRIASKSNTPIRDTLTVFHAKRPNKGSANGARRWGPDLSKYLHTLIALLSFGGSDDSEVSAMELTLAMIYMDRACSVETPRSDGHVPCPYCTPRTVHRLVAASLLVAVESARGTHFSERLHSKVSDTLNITKLELKQMVDWLRGALGDQETFVGSEQLQDFATAWNSRFGAILPNSAYEPLVSQQIVPLSAPHEMARSASRRPSMASVFA